jgi:hypothetical protein
MSISNLRFDEGIVKINSNDNKPLDTLITEKTNDLLLKLGYINYMGYNYKPITSFNGYGKHQTFDTGYEDASVLMVSNLSYLYTLSTSGTSIANFKKFSISSGTLTHSADVVAEETLTGLKFFPVKNKIAYINSRKKNITLYNANDLSIFGSTANVSSNYVSDFEIVENNLYVLGSKYLSKYELNTLSETRKVELPSSFGAAKMFVEGGNLIVLSDSDAGYLKIKISNLEVSSISSDKYNYTKDAINYNTPIILTKDQLKVGRLSTSLNSGENPAHRCFLSTDGKRVCVSQPSARAAWLYDINNLNLIRNINYDYPVAGAHLGEAGIFVYDASSGKINLYNGIDVVRYERI